MKKLHHVLMILALAGLMPTLTACDEILDAIDNPVVPSTPAPETVAIGGITINLPSGIADIPQMKPGETLQLSISVTPAGADNSAVNWLTSDATVASVSAQGLITALKAGKATITVESKTDKSVSAKLTIEIVEATTEEPGDDNTGGAAEEPGDDNTGGNTEEPTDDPTDDPADDPTDDINVNKEAVDQSKAESR